MTQQAYGVFKAPETTSEAEALMAHFFGDGSKASLTTHDILSQWSRCNAEARRENDIAERQAQLFDLAKSAPITFDLVVRSHGGAWQPRLHVDEDRAALMAMWSTMAFEWAEAMLQEHEDRLDVARQEVVS